MKIIRFFISISLTILFLNAAKKSQSAYKEHSKKFILITVLYNETEPMRIKEYITCLEKNLHHPLIELVHVIYDTSKDNLTKNHSILEYLLEHKLVITYVDDRPTYGDCFRLVNKLYPQKNIILSNADIYFNETLAALARYDLTNKFIALTRWDVRGDEKLAPCRIISYDAWIFKTPLKSFEDNIAIGTNECDLLIGYHAQKAGLHVINPCLTIKCCHLHLSGVRNYEFHKHNKLPNDYRTLSRSLL